MNETSSRLLELLALLQGRRDWPGAELAERLGVSGRTIRRDVAAAKEFYGAVFGWEVLEMDGGFNAWALPGYGEFLDELNPGTVERMATMGAPKGFENVVASIVPIPDDQPDAPPHWGVTFATEDADAIAAKAEELGGEVLAGPFDAPWVRMAVIVDPAGGIFTASQFVPENNNSGLGGSRKR